MTDDDSWAPDKLENEPCDNCGVTPSRHEGHGSFTCKACYDARWCPECHYDMRRQPHVCPSLEERQQNRIFTAASLIATNMDDNLMEALILAEELTRDERYGGPWIPECKWCSSTAAIMIRGTDRDEFVHKPDCKWKRLRNMFDKYND